VLLRPTKRARLSQPPATNSSTAGGPSSKRPSMQLNPSARRPQVAAGERLRLWIPVGARNLLDQQSRPTNLTDDNLKHISTVMRLTRAELNNQPKPNSKTLLILK
jgi:hypothetical protein